MKPTAANMLPALAYARSQPQVSQLLHQRDSNNQTYLHSCNVESVLPLGPNHFDVQITFDYLTNNPANNVNEDVIAIVRVSWNPNIPGLTFHLLSVSTR